ncbi:MAG: Gfo/Idh/MocA family oxidoreductase, partial [Planctomycetaceae bacterium]|nr:Gfo/Idh/MocA family oxidoreductase [Planctomycetaceae bacterium]
MTDSEAELQNAIVPPLPRDKDIGIGCVGAGFIMADCHLVAYRRNGLNPVAITSRTRDRSDEVAVRHDIPQVCESVEEVVQQENVRILDVAVPPDCQADIIRRALGERHHLSGILAQKPLGRSYAEASDIVAMCRDAGVTLAVNQNMRFDQSVRACDYLLKNRVLGQPVLATIDMRAIPHWMPWQ